MSRSFQPIPVKSILFSAVTNTYAPLGTVLEEALQILVIKNTTDATIFISENGSADHYELLPSTVEVYDFQTNAKTNATGAKNAQTQFYVKGVTGSLPTTGKIIIQGQFI
jgi:hypothetical protein